MVQIVEVSPRDGLQNEDVLLDTDTKVALITRAIDAGARRIEATSFVHPGRVPQMADAEAVMASVPRREDVAYIGLALNERGVARALSAACDEVNLVVVASDTFSQRNQGMATAHFVAALPAAVKRIHDAGARASVTLAAAFGCPFEGEVDVARVKDLARQVVESGVDELALADTIGVAVPSDVRARVSALDSVRGDVPLRLHLHDTRNTAVANAAAAIEAGVEVLDASLGGIGGCPFAPAATGNVATEDLLYLLERSGEAHHWNVQKAMAAASWVGEQLGRPVPGALTRAGWFPPPIWAA